MADELVTEEAGTATADKPKEKPRLGLAVDITDTGPCKKHIRVSVPRSDIERVYNDEFGTLAKDAAVPGFRKGRTPRKLIERRFRKDVAQQVKSALLMQSLEQVAEDNKIEPLSEPK